MSGKKTDDMKIAIIRKRYTYHGGAEGFSSGLIENLAESGHEVHVYAIEWQAHAKQDNVYFHNVPAVGWNSFLRDLSFALSSFFLLKRERFDIVQTHDKTFLQDIYRAGDGCHIEWLKQRWKRAGVPGKVSILCNPYHWLVLAMERFIFKGRRYKKVIAISEMVKQDIIINYGVPSPDIAVLYNGVDTMKFHPEKNRSAGADIRRRYGLDEHEFVLLFVGSGFERKGVKFLLQAIEAVDAPVTLLIVGKGPEDRYRHNIKKQRVIFCGPQREIEKYYAAADLFVFPTLYEPFGNVHLEALASGLPVITTRRSGASELIDDGRQGYVVNRPEDVSVIAEKISLLMDRDRRRTMSAEARKRAELFSFARHKKDMINLYGTVRELNS